MDRFCWLKGDLTLESLRQAVIEPAERAWIGTSARRHAISSEAISEVATSGTAWLTNTRLELNPALVAIIGARGSGKTALAETIADQTT